MRGILLTCPQVQGIGNRWGREHPKPLDPTSKGANHCAESSFPLFARASAEPLPLPLEAKKRSLEVRGILSY